MRIKFGDVQISEKSRKHINECLDSNHVTMGPKTKMLEKLWAEKFGYKEVRAVSSGTAACIAACLSLYDRGANPGDEIIVPGLSFIATANAVRAAGFVPIFCDINKETLVIDETKIEELMCHKTRAIMPVALMGKPPKMDVIKKLGEKYKVAVILDNCEGHGCKYKGKYMSKWADIVVYSCYAAHILFSGELGLVGCSDKKTADVIESVRSHGRPINSLYFSHERYGLNLKPTDIHASIGLGNFEDFDTIMATRTENLKYLRNGLKGFEDYFYFCEEDKGDTNSPHAFSLTIKPLTGLSIKKLQKALDDVGIEWKRNFGAMNDHGCFKYLYGRYETPNARYVGDNGLHIGVHQGLSKEDLDRIVATIRNIVEKNK
jgi:dTDP-4-amino-4,6-dideoxygalactose transaminase